MKEFTCQVQAQGRVAIPKDIRTVEGIEKGDIVTVKVQKAKMT
jgi:AbrB family looped-hinge helix DNA binding protein